MRILPSYVGSHGYRYPPVHSLTISPHSFFVSSFTLIDEPGSSVITAKRPPAVYPALLSSGSARAPVYSEPCLVKGYPLSHTCRYHPASDPGISRAVPRPKYLPGIRDCLAGLKALGRKVAWSLKV